MIEIKKALVYLQRGSWPISDYQEGGKIENEKNEEKQYFLAGNLVVSGS